MKKQGINLTKDMQLLYTESDTALSREITEELNNIADWGFWEKMLTCSLGAICLLGISSYERKEKGGFELQYRPYKAWDNLTERSKVNIAQQSCSTSNWSLYPFPTPPPLTP